MPGRGGHAAKCLGPPLDPITWWSRGKMPGRGGHAAKCLGPPLDPIAHWTRGEMPGTSLSPYYPLVTRGNAWDLPLTLLPFGHAGKCLWPPLAGHDRQPVMTGSAASPPVMTGSRSWPAAFGHAAKCLGPPNDPITYWSRGKMPGRGGHAAKCLGPPLDPIS